MIRSRDKAVEDAKNTQYSKVHHHTRNSFEGDDGWFSTQDRQELQTNSEHVFLFTISRLFVEMDYKGTYRRSWHSSERTDTKYQEVVAKELEGGHKTSRITWFCPWF